MSFGAETGLTVLDSSAAIKAEARSCEDTGVVTCELILLSKHHLTADVRVREVKLIFRYSCTYD